MNYINHLNNFFHQIKQDQNLTPFHITLYLALFHHWNHHRFQNPFPIYRDDIMHLSKIGSKNTYHKCIKELHKARYIIYHPSQSRYQPVKITITNLEKKPNTNQLNLFKNQNPNNDTNTVPHLTNTSPKTDTYTVPNPVHLIKHTNNINNEYTPTHEKIFTKNKKIQWKINQLAAPKPVQEKPPTIQEVEHFFHQHNYPTEESKKFYYYNQSKNWLLQKNIPITDWQSVAHKWILNTKNYNNKNNTQHDTKPPHSINNPIPDTRNNKNYSEPL